MKRTSQLNLVEFGSAEAIVAADLIDASLRAFPKQLTFVNVDAGGFTLVSESESFPTLAEIPAIHVDAVVMASMVRARASLAVGLVRIIGAISERVADLVSRNAFFRTASTLPFSGGAVLRGMCADSLVGSVFAVVHAVADPRMRDTDVRVEALKPAERALDLMAESGDFVAAVAAVVFPVAAPQLGDAKRVVAGKLVGRTGFLAVELVRTVRAICKEKEPGK